MHGDPAPGERGRVLLVEDEYLLALTLGDDLRASGWTVIGPFQDLKSALDGAARESFDLAILDVNLDGTMVFPLAERLLARGVPFVFLTGYAAANLPEHLRGVPRVGKPYDYAQLSQAIMAIVGDGP